MQRGAPACRAGWIASALIDGLAQLGGLGKQHPFARRAPNLTRFIAARHALIAPGGSLGGVVDQALAARGLERQRDESDAALRWLRSEILAVRPLLARATPELARPSRVRRAARSRRA